MMTAERTPFRIGFIGPNPDPEALESWLGRVWFSEEQYETFIKDFDTWSAQEYERSWLGQLELITSGEGDRAMLITNIGGPSADDVRYLRAYLLFRGDGDEEVIVRENLWFEPAIPLPQGFDAMRPELSVDVREGEAWEICVSVSSIHDFVRHEAEGD